MLKVCLDLSAAQGLFLFTDTDECVRAACQNGGTGTDQSPLVCEKQIASRPSDRVYLLNGDDTDKIGMRFQGFIELFAPGG